MHEVCIFSGEKGLPLLKLCLQRYSTMYDEPLRLKVLSDGSICDRADITKEFRNAEIISNRDLDKRAKRLIHHHPRTMEAYEEDIMVRKLIYSKVASDSYRINYSDSDIILIRRTSNLFGWSDGNVFMDNNYSMISIAWKDADLVNRLPLISSLNAGLFSVDRDLINIDVIEWVLSFPRIAQGSRFHLEQTIWSALAAQEVGKTYLYDKRQVCFPDVADIRTPSLAVLHFTRPNRGKIEELSVERDGVVQIGRSSASILSPMRFLRERLAAKVLRALK